MIDCLSLNTDQWNGTNAVMILLSLNSGYKILHLSQYGASPHITLLFKNNSND